MLFYTSEKYHSEFPYYLYDNVIDTGGAVHSQDFYEVFLTCSDSVLWYYGKTKTILPYGTVVFVPPGKTHYMRPSFGCSMKYINLSFSAEEYLNTLDFLGLRMQRNVLETGNKMVSLPTDKVEILKKHLKGINLKNFSNEKKRMAYSRLVLASIIMELVEDENFNSEIPSWLNDLCRWLKKDMNMASSIEEVCSYCRKSPEYLCRSMRKYIGTTPTKYINNLRLEYVAGMLETSNRSIGEMYLEVGFFSKAHFNKLFKEKYKMTPNEYRKQHKIVQ